MNSNGNISLALFLFSDHFFHTHDIFRLFHLSSLKSNASHYHNLQTKSLARNMHYFRFRMMVNLIRYVKFSLLILAFFLVLGVKTVLAEDGISHWLGWNTKEIVTGRDAGRFKISTFSGNTHFKSFFSETIKVHEYDLKPWKDENGTIHFYTAYNRNEHRFEYIILPAQIDHFTQNISFYRDEAEKFIHHLILGHEKASLQSCHAQYDSFKGKRLETLPVEEEITFLKSFDFYDPRIKVLPPAEYMRDSVKKDFPETVPRPDGSKWELIPHFTCAMSGHENDNDAKLLLVYVLAFNPDVRSEPFQNKQYGRLELVIDPKFIKEFVKPRNIALASFAAHSYFPMGGGLPPLYAVIGSMGIETMMNGNVTEGLSLMKEANKEAVQDIGFWAQMTVSAASAIKTIFPSTSGVKGNMVLTAKELEGMFNKASYTKSIPYEKPIEAPRGAGGGAAHETFLSRGFVTPPKKPTPSSSNLKTQVRENVEVMGETKVLKTDGGTATLDQIKIPDYLPQNIGSEASQAVITTPSPSQPSLIAIAIPPKEIIPPQKAIEEKQRRVKEEPKKKVTIIQKDDNGKIISIRTGVDREDAEKMKTPFDSVGQDGTLSAVPTQPQDLAPQIQENAAWFSNLWKIYHLKLKLNQTEGIQELKTAIENFITKASLYNFAQVDEHLFRSSAIHGKSAHIENTAPLIEALGIKTVISLVEKEDGFDPEVVGKALKKRNIDLIHIPMDMNRSLWGYLKELLVLIHSIQEGKIKGHVLVHCQSGKDKTGFFVQLYRLLVSNFTAQEAAKDSEPFYVSGYQSHKETEERINILNTLYIIDKLRKGQSPDDVRIGNFDISKIWQEALSTELEITQVSWSPVFKKKQTQSYGAPPRFLGTSQNAQDIHERVGKYMHPEVLGHPVFIQGPIGTPSLSVALSIAQMTLKEKKSQDPIIVIRCGALPSKDLLESFFFGHKAGSFTGASGNQPGLFETAKNGVIIFDHIEDLSLEGQALLLRVLENHTFLPIGSSSPLVSKARIIAIATTPLPDLIQSNSIRLDFAQRIRILPLNLQPLAQRKEDIPLLLQSYLEDKNVSQGLAHISFTNSALLFLITHPWMGNEQELICFLKTAQTLFPGQRLDEATVKELLDHVALENSRIKLEYSEFTTLLQEGGLEGIEIQAIKNRLLALGGSVTKTAQSLKISARVLYGKMKTYNLVRGDFLLKTKPDSPSIAPVSSPPFATAIAAKKNIGDFIGSPIVIDPIQQFIDRALRVKHPILIQGETGTGKELIAKALVSLSDRSKITIVNCGSFVGHKDMAIEKLFGHKKGSFTGAANDKSGAFEIAQGGWLFLDELETLPLEVQDLILDVLIEGRVRKLGDPGHSYPIDIRLVVATNEDLKKLVQEGKIKKELAYYLNILSIHIPPLRERTYDIPIMIEDWKQKHPSLSFSLTKEALDFLLSQYWAGNVRELLSSLEYLSVIHEGNIDKQQCQKALDEFILLNPSISTRPPLPRDSELSLEDISHTAIQRVIESTHGNKTKAAILLKIPVRTLYRILEKQPSDELKEK